MALRECRASLVLERSTTRSEGCVDERLEWPYGWMLLGWLVRARKGYRLGEILRVVFRERRLPRTFAGLKWFPKAFHAVRERPRVGHAYDAGRPIGAGRCVRRSLRP